MSALDWDKLRIFHAVAEAGSLTHAGEALGLSQSAVSRQIGALEAQLNATLFHRHARGLILTEQGELLYRTAREIFARLAVTEAMIADAKDKPSGDLCVTTTVAFGTIWLAPRLREFMDLYPDIRIEMVVDDRELDLSMREADVAIRMWKPTQADLIYRKLLTVHNHVYASVDYVTRHGAPQTLEDLDHHKLIVYGEEAPAYFSNINWLLKAGDPVAPREPTLSINNVYGVMQAVASGLGIASLPDYMAEGNPRIVRVLPNVDGPGFDTFLVYPEELRNTKRLAVFRDFLLRKVADWQY
ncbi:LysR family transcriptional regulator [uncultured Ferrovibrio sp.]|jgi:DNA-binding transcriptional LysR family regulator|uniref:LysR family transcriptional regulator n=1 Tax=uncultured Ferrovibrio sp. TaxID=1576913 RepID=UPI00263924CE|nr:LysR family transcriptional regulator [uncultured Ferrovibrio sp.]